MKKQILLLIVAFLASMSVAFGQAPNLGAALAECPEPTTITAACVANAGPLNPIAGTEYTYTVTIPTPPGGKQFHWFVTTDLNFIATGDLTLNREAGDGTGPHIAASGLNYNVKTAGPVGDNSVDITWKAFTHNPLQPVLLVVYVEDDDCQTNNLEAFLIRPVHAFTLDIASVNSVDGSINITNDHEICVSPVQTATYVITNPATGEGEIQFNYGTNYMFFVVTAANFSHSWLPSFEISGAGMRDSRIVTEVAWAYPAAAVSGTWTAMTGSGGTGTEFTSTTPVLAQATNGTVGEDGECIVVRVTIANNQVETTIDDPITLAVDGVMRDPGATAGNEYANALLGDIHYAEGPASECPWIDLFENDKSTQILAPRPDINENDPTPFVPTDKE
jgi:hypothetical protein